MAAGGRVAQCSLDRRREKQEWFVSVRVHKQSGGNLHRGGVRRSVAVVDQLDVAWRRHGDFAGSVSIHRYAGDQQLPAFLPGALALIGEFTIYDIRFTSGRGSRRAFSKLRKR